MRLYHATLKSTLHAIKRTNKIHGWWTPYKTGHGAASALYFARVRLAESNKPTVIIRADIPDEQLERKLGTGYPYYEPKLGYVSARNVTGVWVYDTKKLCWLIFKTIASAISGRRGKRVNL